MKQDRANTVVVGSGPGGATVTRKLARKGDDVIILERGRDHRWSVGSVFAYATMYDIKKSKHGVLVRRGITTRGSTMLYSGNAPDALRGLRSSSTTYQEELFDASYAASCQPYL